VEQEIEKAEQEINKRLEMLVRQQFMKQEF